MKRFLDSPEDLSPADVIVVGGGISGAAVAYEAATRGYSVILLEKRDFGWATSAATSKLIHGGLRYLNNAEFGLVRESLRERRILENIAPNLVRPLPFIIPSYKGDKVNRWIIRIGMLLYDILSFDKSRTWIKSQRIPTHRWLSPADIRQMEPSVREEGLTGGSMYYDCQSIFPERLTLAFVRSAVDLGVRTANHATVTGFLRDPEGRVTGVSVKDDLSGMEHRIAGRVTVNCGGPWADIILGMAAGSDTGHTIRRSEGIHIVTKKMVNDHAVIIMTPAGRHLFVIPWHGRSLIGTTDVEYTGDPDAYRVSRQSIQDLIDEVNASFGDGRLTYNDVLFTYGGLRPLVEEETAGTYESSRKYEIYDNASDGLDGLITVEGGKYTTSRNLASSVLDQIDRKTGRRGKTRKTSSRFLKGCEIPDRDALIESLEKKHPGYPPDVLSHITDQYGSDGERLLAMADDEPGLAKRITPDGHILVEAVYAARNEMARTLEDVIFRRTGIGNTGHPGDDAINAIGNAVAAELGWDPKRLSVELNTVRERFRLP